MCEYVVSCGDGMMWDGLGWVGEVVVSEGEGEGGEGCRIGRVRGEVGVSWKVG